MATIDPVDNTLVVRVVYDGPPQAGKTTSVCALAAGLGGEVVAPSEIDGRTVFFDWLEYTGGLFEGRRIRFQIVSVPGQASLAGRRRHLLGTADVIVFVGDTTREAQDSVNRYLKSLNSVLLSIPGPPIGIVLQANKRDHPDAVPVAEMRAKLESDNLNVAIVESVATENVGVRETFVLAARLALERIRELIRLDMLKTATPDVNSADDLLDAIRQSEGGEFRALPSEHLVHTRLSDVAVIRPASSAAHASDSPTNKIEQAAMAPNPGNSAVHTGAGDVQTDLHRDDTYARVREVATAMPPLLPSYELPSGLIWPPVAGRITLHGILQAPMQIIATRGGHWVGQSSSDWLAQSPASGVFPTMQAGREALLVWARLHAGCNQVISERRCIALANDGQGQYRLWQFVRKEVTQLAKLREAIAAGAPAVATFLVSLVQLHAWATQVWPGAGCRLPIRLDSLVATSTGPRHVGQMPYPIPAPLRSDAARATTAEWLLRELHFARKSLARDADAIIRELESASRRDPAKLSAHVPVLREMMFTFRQEFDNPNDLGGKAASR